MDEELIEEGPTFLTQFFWFFTPEEVYTIVDSEGRESTVVDIDIGGAKRRFLPDKKTGAIAYYYMHPEAEGLRTSGKMYQLGKVSVGTFTPVVINEETGELSEMPSYFLETPDIERLENQYPEEVVDPSMSGALVSTPLKFQAKVQIQRTTLTTQSKVFKSLTVGMMSPDEIRQISVLEVTNHNTLTTTKSPTPVANGPVDGRLGAGDHSNVCLTCDLKRDNNPENDCTGHFGHLELPIPVPHPLFAISSNPNSLQDAFNMFCHNCGKVPISDVVKERLLPQVDRTFERSRNDSGLRRIKNRTKAAMTDAKVVNSATGTMDCPHCEEKSPLLDWDRTKMMFLLRPFKKGLGGNTYYDYSTAHLLLQQIPDEDARLMGFDAPMMRPEYMFIEALPIAPNTMRPMGKDFNTGQPIENDLTLMYQQAIWRARKYREDEMSGYDPGLMTTQRAKELFVSVAHCIYNQDKKIGSFGSKSVRTKSGSEKNTIKSGILDEIVGVGRKKSSFRRRINSKTVNNVVRSVITPSGGLSINEVGVPKVSCLGTFVRVTVTEENIEHLRELVIKGVPENMDRTPPTKNGTLVDQRYPGAHWVEPWGIPTKKPFSLTDLTLWSDSKSSSNNTWTPIGLEWVEYSETLERPEILTKDGKTKAPMSDDDWSNTLRKERADWQYRRSMQMRSERWGVDGTRPLQVGDIVARTLLEGDYVLFGRQPSLHRQSLNGLRVVPMNQHSISFNPAICVPMNADFDGDQCNMYVPASEEAMDEIRDNLQMRDNLIHHRMGKLVIGTDHDQTSGVYLLTMKNKNKKGTFNSNTGVGYDDDGVVYFTKDKMCEIFQQVYFKADTGDMEYITDFGEPDRDAKHTTKESYDDNGKLIPPTTKDYKIKTYSGYRCVSLLIPSGINAEFKSGLIYDDNGAVRRDESTGKPIKDHTLIMDGEVVHGTLDKTFMGKEKGTLGPSFYYRFGYEEGHKQMHRFVDMLCRLGFAAHHAVGYSMGVADCGIPAKYYPVVREGYDITSQVCAVINKAFADHDMQRFVDEEQWLATGEYYMTKREKQQLLDASPYSFRQQLIYEAQSFWEDNIVSEVSDIAGSHNAMEIAVRSGGRGKELNIQQMSSAYGQVRISGTLPSRGLESHRDGLRRMFAHYPLPDKDISHPAHFGYVKNSYYTGLEPHEYFTVCIAGRRSDMESSSGALQDSGYLANKMRRGMESLVVDQHRRVVDLRDDKIVSFTAGDDGFRPYASKMVNRFPDGQVSDTKGNVEGGDEDFTIELQPYFFDYTCKHSTPLALSCDQCTKGSAYVDYFADKMSKSRNKSLHNQRLSNAVTSKLGSREVMKRTVDAMLDRLEWWVGENLVQPGEAIGSTAAGCLAEPATQASLRTFHSGGKGKGASVKRLEAVVQATDAVDEKTDYNVFTSVDLKPEFSDLENAEKIAKWCTVQYIGDILEVVDYEPSEGLVIFNIDQSKVDEKGVDLGFVNRQLTRMLKSTSAPPGSLIEPLKSDGGHFIIKCPPTGREMLNMKEYISLIQVSGLPDGGVTYLEPKGDRWSLLIAGSASNRLWESIIQLLPDFVDVNTIWCDNPVTVEKQLGLEAGLACAEDQLNYQMNSSKGIGEYDYRYIRTIVDSMGVHGVIRGHGPSGQSVRGAPNLIDAMSMESLKISLLAGVITRNTSNLQSIAGSTVSGRAPLVGKTFSDYRTE